MTRLMVYINRDAHQLEELLLEEELDELDELLLFSLSSDESFLFLLVCLFFFDLFFSL